MEMVHMNRCGNGDGELDTDGDGAIYYDCK